MKSLSHRIPSSVWKNPIHFLAFGFGSGAVPIAPGTFGTLVAIPIYYVLQSFSPLFYGVVLCWVIFGGIWICGVTATDIGVHDHSGIVWDEIAGYLLTMWFAPPGFFSVILGFILFRLFDIWKPWPIRRIDQQVQGGWGIMLDDILAGIYAALLLHAFLYLKTRL